MELQTATLAAERRSAEQLRMLFYWLSQRTAASRMAEPFALAEFEFHRTLCEASQNPFLRAASALVEFGVVRATAARIRAGVEDLGAEKAALCQVMADAVASADTRAVRTAMAEILESDRTWIVNAAAG